MSEAQRETAANVAQRPATARAEDVIDHAGERVGQFAALLGRRLQVLAARAREEAEDIWAEAQSRRHANEQP
ncbi:MAG: hypothetical protein M3Y74_11845 [Chloroflexota bacterium]|nr:hypothetical protein [Chloroflexota bacterium]